MQWTCHSTHTDGIISLCDLKVHEKGRIQRVQGSRALKKRLLEMGFTRGEEITLDKIAPLGDPLDFIIKGYHISLRKGEASLVLISLPGTPYDRPPGQKHHPCSQEPYSPEVR